MITVKKPGFFSTIQDNGRIGFQRYGVIVSGVMDTVAFRLGNALLKQSNEAAIEMTLVGGTFVFSKATTIVLTGGTMHAKLNGQPVAMYKRIAITAGDELVCGSIQGRAYVCIKGGITVPAVMNSRSTYVKAQLGGYNGRALEKGDMLPYDETTPLPPTRQIAAHHFYKTTAIRILQGTEWERLAPLQKPFLQNTYRLSLDADRMGYRLVPHTPITIEKPFQLISEAVTFGTIQLPPSGEPIILMADRQTTGGYPKVGQVVFADLHRLAQLLPNATITFKIVTIEEAERSYEELERALRLIEIMLAQL